MHATWLPRSSNNLNCLSQRLRIPLLAPQFPQPRACPLRRRPACFSTSCRHLQPQAEPEAEAQSENTKEHDELLESLQEIRHIDRNPQPKRKNHARQPFRRVKVTVDQSDQPRVQRKPRPPPPDYVGHYVHPLRDGFVPDRKLPWYQESLKLSLPLVRLNQELDALAEHLLPSDKERVARNCVAQDILTLFSLNKNKALHGFGLEAFGSEVNSLSTITSDLDFRLFDRSIYDSDENDLTQAPRWEQRKRATHALSQLKTALKYIHQPPVAGTSRDPNQNQYLFQTPVVLHARYPLIETTHRPTSIDIQIVCCNDPSHSLKTMDQYMEEIPYIQTIYVVLRRTLAVRGLTEVFMGGIGSYTLFYMIVAALKHGPSPMPSTAGEALLQVLGFYTGFDSDNNWISIDPPQINPKRQPPQEEGAKPQVGILWPERPYLLSIRDPADPHNDLPRQSFAWRHIRTTFAVLRKELTLRLKTGDERLLLVPFVGRHFDDVQVKREALLRYHKSFSIGKLRPIEDSVQDPAYVRLNLPPNSDPEVSAAEPSDAEQVQEQKPADPGQETFAAQESRQDEFQEQQPAEPAQASFVSEESHLGMGEQKAAEPAQEPAAADGSHTEPHSEHRGV